MPPYNDFTWSETQSQPEAWAATLDTIAAQAGELRAFLGANPFDQVVLTGCGSTYYLALAAAASLREIANVRASGLPASELWLNPQGSFPAGGRTLLVPVSRSGETSETLRAVAAFREAGRGPILTISCYAERPLAQMGDYNLVIAAGQEQSIAQTRAFSTQYLATLALAATLAGRDDLLAALGQLPAAARQILADSAGLARELGGGAIDRVFFLGSGARYGLACELSLKMKEMSLSESEPFHFLEYRHGPQSMARPGTLIVGLLSEAQGEHERAVLGEMQALGARVVAVGPRADEVALAELPDQVRGPLYLPFGQMLAYERAVSRGLTPDQPSQLSAVVKLQ